MVPIKKKSKKTNKQKWYGTDTKPDRQINGTEQRAQK